MAVTWAETKGWVGGETEGRSNMSRREEGISAE
jgi:hypothetical protein